MPDMSVSVKHNGITRNVQCSQSQYTGTEYVLQRTSRTTPFLRQVELFSGVSIRSQAINEDRTIQRIADGIRDLQGFNEEDSEGFRKDGKQIILKSIDFDSEELRIVERESKNVSKSRHRKERTVKELWASVIEEPDELESPGQEITDFLNMAYPRSDSAKDGQNEERLKSLRKTIHCLEDMEERIKLLREKVNTSERVNSDREKEEERNKLLEAIQCLINFKKAMLAIFDAKQFPAPDMDVENLDGSLKPDMSLAEILKVWEIIKSMYNESKIQAIRRWLLVNVVLKLTVLLFDNSKSMTTKNKASAAIEFAKKFIAYLKQNTDLVAIAVITFGGGPRCLKQFTLLENLNANTIDNITFQGCTPLSSALIYGKRYTEEFKEKICSGLPMGNSDLPTYFDYVMVTDILPTELHKDSNGGVSNLKDECPETSEKFAKMMREFKETSHKSLEDEKSSIVLVSLSENSNQLVNIFRPEHKGYVLDISSMENPYPVLAVYNLHQKYSSGKEVIHKLTKNYLAQDKIIRGDDHPRAEIYHQLSREWEINIDTKSLALSDRDNQDINIHLTELRTSKSKPIYLHLHNKKTFCRIIPKTGARGISNGEDKSKHEAYNIKVAATDSVELKDAELVRRRRLNQ